MTIIILIFTLCPVTQIFSQQRASSNWGVLDKYLVIQPSLNVSAWETRSIVTNMRPVGDGTYQVRMDLTPGQYYNYLFMAKTGTNAISGLNLNSTYYDQPPGTGKIPTSKNPNTIQYTNQAWYGKVTANEDQRRILFVPNLNDGESLYVFNNFNSTPNPPDTVEALPGNTRVILNWSKAHGPWKWDDVNVIAGGKYYLYYNATGAADNYSLLTTLEGNVTSFTHTGLNNGTTYYYIIVSGDAYLGAGSEPFEHKKSDLPPPGGAAGNQAYATPRGTMPVYFKVEHIDWNVVEKGQYLVWLTPSEEDGRFYRNKRPGRIIKVTVGDN